LNLVPLGQARGVSLLLISAAFAETASNVVYVVLVERAYQLGGATAIGLVLILQAAAQVIFGSWAGGIADQWGFRKAASVAALITAPLILALAFAQNILLVYFLAFLFMLARLLLIPARFGLVAQLSGKSRLAESNAAILIIAGAGSFVGPAIAAALLFTTDGFGLPLLVAGVGWILSVPPLVMIRPKPAAPPPTRRPSFFGEVQTGWHLIRKRVTISQVLVCLLLAALFLGATTPLFTPLSRELGLGSEGTGIFFSALGFGYLIGPGVATALFKRIRLSTVLLIAGLLAPIGLMLIGTLEQLVGVLIAIALVSAAGAGVNVIVTTITQRLTPPKHRGTVLGTEQTLLGLAWIVSLGVITGVTAIWKTELNVRLLFLVLGSIGFISILTCWLWNKRPIQAACAHCEPRFRLSPVACGALQVAPFGLSGAVCGAICGKECQCCS
jgi:MFS family permease